MSESLTSPAHRGRRPAAGPADCLCGARAHDGTSCRKCDARARWHRRTAGARRSITSAEVS